LKRATTAPAGEAAKPFGRRGVLVGAVQVSLAIVVYTYLSLGSSRQATTAAAIDSAPAAGPVAAAPQAGPAAPYAVEHPVTLGTISAGALVGGVQARVERLSWADFQGSVEWLTSRVRDLSTGIGSWLSPAAPAAPAAPVATDAGIAAEPAASSPPPRFY
jgi:hypothetical protein